MLHSDNARGTRIVTMHSNDLLSNQKLFEEEHSGLKKLKSCLHDAGTTDARALSVPLHPQQLHAVTVSDGNPVGVCFGPLELVHGRRSVVNQNRLVDAFRKSHQVPNERHAVIGGRAYVAFAVGRPGNAVDACVVRGQHCNRDSGHTDVEHDDLQLPIRT